MHKHIQRMLSDIRKEVEYTRSMIGKDALDPQILEVMGRIPRDQFVPEAQRNHAYDNGPLPIGHGQTISQPYIVALMTDMLAPQPHHRVLEIGTGSGYQTAILASLCERVYSVELTRALSEQATERFRQMSLDNIETRVSDGYQGWPEHAPYDGIMVTAAAPYVPEALLDQLKTGGRLIIPVGEPYSHQDLILLEKEPDGSTRQKHLLAVAFVPLRHGETS